MSLGFVLTTEKDGEIRFLAHDYEGTRWWAGRFKDALVLSLEKALEESKRPLDGRKPVVREVTLSP